MKLKYLLPIASALALATPGLAENKARPAAAMPTQQQQATIEQNLRSQGFTSWGEVKRYGDSWTVKNARNAEGQAFTLKLDSNYAITEREREGQPS